MAQITFTIPDTELTRMVTGIAYSLGYSDFVFDTDGITQIPNPETKGAFAKRKTREWWITLVKNYEATAAAQAAAASARATAEADIDTNIVIT